MILICHLLAINDDTDVAFSFIALFTPARD